MASISVALSRALDELRAEKITLEKAIDNLKALLSGAGRVTGRRATTRGGAKRRGRRPKMAAPKASRKRGKAWTAGKRRAAAQRMKRYWAEWRKKNKGE